MNESSKTPRFICRLARRWTVLFGSEQPLENHGLASRHIEQCEDCRKFYASVNELNTWLRNDARGFASARADLADDIVAAFRKSAISGLTEPPRSRPQVFAFAGVGLLAVALAIVFVAVKKSPAKNEFVAATPEDVHQTLLAAQGASQKLWASVKPSAVALTARDPLNDELNSVVADARSAVNFLALNFVPDATQTQSPANASPREGGA